MEADKLVGTVILDGVTIRQINFQSSSVDLLSMSNSTVTGALNGTPKKAVVTFSRITTLKPGAYYYGRSDEVICANCVISNLIPGGVSEQGTNGEGVNVSYTMSGGVITAPNRLGALPWAVPGTNLMWSGQYSSETSFKVIDVTQDSANTYVQTTLTGGFPGVPRYNGKLSIHVHPSPIFTCLRCMGNVDVVDLAQPGAQGKPLYSYSRRTYTGSTIGNGASVSTMELWGRLVSLKVNVAAPYAGSLGRLTLHLPSGSDNYPTIKSDGSVFRYAPIINLKIAGERVITPAGVSGAQRGDSALSVPEAVWFTGQGGIAASADISGESLSMRPTVTIEIVTEQGVVNP